MPRSRAREPGPRPTAGPGTPAPPSSSRPWAARPDASMSLLVDLMGSQALDPGYAAAAAARGTTRPRGSRPATALSLAVAGAVVGMAAGQLRAQLPAQARAHEQLRREAVASLSQLDALRAAVTHARADVEQALGPATGEARRAATGLAPVSGPGVQVELDDAPGGGARVLDRDLQRLVNALWAAGAEAVAVGGQRLTGLSAIRSAGEAVLVGYRPLRPPYLVEAIGDPTTLQARLVLSPAYRQLETLGSAVGVRVSQRTARTLRLPAADAPARTAPAGGTAP